MNQNQLLSVSLPFPPVTGNHQYDSYVRTIRTKNGSLKPVVKKSLKPKTLQYQNEVALLIRSTQNTLPKSHDFSRSNPNLLTRRLAVAILVSPPDNRARDFDNLQKVLMDAIKSTGIIQDDSMKVIPILIMLCGSNVKGGHISVQLTDINNKAEFFTYIAKITEVKT